MSTWLIALLFAAFVAVIYALLGGTRHHRHQTFHDVTAKGVPLIRVENSLGRAGDEMAKRVVRRFREKWPCLLAAYGLDDPKVPRINYIEIRRDVRWEGKPVNGLTIYGWPLSIVELRFDPTGHGAISWELRNVARRGMAEMHGAGEFDKVPGDDQAERCLGAHEEVR